MLQICSFLRNVHIKAQLNFLNKLLNLSLLSSMSYQSRPIMYNLFNKFLSDISGLLLHSGVQLRQPYKLIETTQSF